MSRGWKNIENGFDYPRNSHYLHRHHERYKRYVEAHGLMCQECGGAGEYADDWIDGHPLMNDCGWCEGTGKVTRWVRGFWLRDQRKITRLHRGLDPLERFFA